MFGLNDGSSVKLTVSQYLTPGKQSIQAVGISPDIKVYPSLVTKDFFDLREDRLYSENDLDSHLSNEKYIKKDKVFYKISYLQEATVEEESQYVSKIKNDYLLDLAAKVLARAGHYNKNIMLKNSKEILEEEAKKQVKEASGLGTAVHNYLESHLLQKEIISGSNYVHQLAKKLAEELISCHFSSINIIDRAIKIRKFFQ